MIPNSIKKITDYIPFFIIGLLLIADEEIENHATDISCQLVINIIVYIVFFLALLYFRKRLLCIIICIVLWLFLIFLKKRLI